MGVSTFLVGCLPTYNQVGVWAPIMLVFLRLCQGFSASGEQAGANSLTLEHAPAHQRAFFTSFTLSGSQAGLIIPTAVFLPFSRLQTEAGRKVSNSRRKRPVLGTPAAQLDGQCDLNT
jgi:MFS family permease